MKQTIYILIIFSFLSCNKRKDNSNSKKLEIKKQIEYQPIFLNLNPKMNDFQFEQNLKSSLPDKKFILPIREYNFEFNLKKESNKIVLEYNDIETLVFMPNLGGNPEKRYLNFLKKDKTEENLVNNFIKLFNNKYSKKITELPILKNQLGEYCNINSSNWSDLSLLKYGFREENYLIFQDSIKTIIIGYTNADNPRKIDRKNLNLLIPSITKTKLASADRKLIESKATEELFWNSLKELNDVSTYQKALKQIKLGREIKKEKGLSLEINYMNNSDFEFIKKKIQTNYESYIQNKKEKDSLQKIKENKGKKNINKI
tara:strand:- start:3438 stop:4382 length:945 start_codon:yes stop_codon:yes gene_type:complete